MSKSKRVSSAVAVDTSWQPIASVPIDTPVLVTDGGRYRLAILKSRAPQWQFDHDASGLSAQGMNFAQNANQFVPTHWTMLPAAPVKT